MRNGAGVWYTLRGPAEYVPFTVAAENGNWKGYVLGIQTLASADLASLQLSQGDLSRTFTENRADYTVSVADNVASINLKAVAVDPLAKLCVTNVTKGEKQGELSDQLNLRYGPNKFVLCVTARDGAKKNYNVTVTRVCSKLEKLTVSYGNVTKSITPSFDPDKHYYTLTLEPGKAIQVDIHAKPLDSTATVKINGDLTANEANWYMVKVNLPGTPKGVPVEVTTADGAKSTYVLLFNGTSSDASLKDLSLRSGDLSPSFNPAVTRYTAKVGLMEKEIKLAATANDPYAGLIVNGKFYSSSSAATTIPLEVGLPGLGPQIQHLEVTVVAPNGSARSYTVMITRGIGR